MDELWNNLYFWRFIALWLFYNSGYRAMDAVIDEWRRTAWRGKVPWWLYAMALLSWVGVVLFILQWAVMVLIERRRYGHWRL